MALTYHALKGGIGFLTRLPVGTDEDDWRAFRESSATFPVVGYIVGLALSAVVVLLTYLSVPGATVAFVYAVSVYALTGVNHVDGVADVGDAVASHGGADEVARVMKDTDTGVGAVLAVVGVVSGLVLAGMTFRGLPLLAVVGVVTSSEVGAKLGCAWVVCLGDASHEGLGSQLTERSSRLSVVVPTLVSLPVALITFPSPSGLVAVSGGVATSLAVMAWSRRRLGGVSGDVMGASNEIGRVVALHLGVVSWTLL